MKVSKNRSVIIVGAGPVGLTVAALLLADKHSEKMRIRILEPRPLPVWDPEEMDLRVYALSRASQRILDYLGVWPEILAARVSPYRRMHIWEKDYRDRLGSLSFDSAEIGEPDLGSIVEDRLIRERLFGLFAASSDVDFNFGAELTAVRVGASTVEIDTQDGETFESSLLIAADGGNSMIRQLLDFPVRTVSYGQDAVVTNVETSKPHLETAWQRFLPDGPLAFLPLIDGRSSIVWSMSSDAAQRLSMAADCNFLEQLQTASGGVLGDISSSTLRASFPLRASHAGCYCCSRVVLVGDAAHTVHPLAGQGMNLGLLDAAVLADTLLEAVRDGQDPGDLRILRRYERQRKGSNVKMLLGMDALHRLFGLQGPFFGPLRAVGLSAVDMVPLAKNRLMRKALGLVGELPSVARSQVA